MSAWPARCAFVLLFSCLSPVAGAAETAPDLAELPFAQLLQQEVVPASMLARQISQSPAAVAIVTAADIRAFGYRTIADVLNSMRGLYTTSDRRYAYMGGRGFGAPGDYAGRIKVLIDGYPTQDSLFNQAYIDESGLIDLELVERVEYVPGTGSVIYGNNALLGIVNIITRRGADLNAFQLSSELASHGGRKQRVTLGRRFDNGADLLLSASGLEATGQDLYFPEYDTPATNRGWAQDQDGERSQRLYGKLSYEGWTVAAGQVDRRKHVPSNPSSLTLFNSPFPVRDQNSFANVRHDADLSLQMSSTTSLYFGHYAYSNRREFADFSDGIRYAERRFEAAWWGLDQKFVGRWWADHVLLFGFELRNDFRQEFHNRYFSPTGGLLPNNTLDATTRRQTNSLYLTDEYRIDPRWAVHVGARYDQASDLAGNWSPRLALIHQADPRTTWKVSYSEAFRMPNADERLNPRLAAAPEFVAAKELVWQHDWTPQTRLTATVYDYQRRDLMQNGLPVGRSRAHGAEFELQAQWPGGARLRTSAAWQRARDIDGQDLANSPDWLGKLNFSFPLPGTSLRSALEGQYVDARRTLTGREFGGYALANLSFSTDRNWAAWSAIVSIRNLFDRQYDAVSPFDWAPGRDALRMDGRTYWLQVSYDL